MEEALCGLTRISDKCLDLISRDLRPTAIMQIQLRKQIKIAKACLKIGGGGANENTKLTR